MIDFLHNLFFTYDGINTAVAVFAFIASAVSIVISAYQFRRTQEDTSRPFIGANIISEEFGDFLYLYIKNYGQESALITCMSINEDIKLVNCDKNSFLSQTMLMPKQSTKIGIDFYNDEFGKNLPLKKREERQEQYRNQIYNIRLEYMNASRSKNKSNKRGNYVEEFQISGRYLSSQCHSEYLIGTEEERTGIAKYIQLIYHSLENEKREF